MDECLKGCRMVRLADDIDQVFICEIWADDCKSDMTALLGASSSPYKSHHVEGEEWQKRNRKGN